MQKQLTLNIIPKVNKSLDQLCLRKNRFLTMSLELRQDNYDRLVCWRYISCASFMHKLFVLLNANVNGGMIKELIASLMCMVEGLHDGI